MKHVPVILMIPSSATRQEMEPALRQVFVSGEDYKFIQDEVTLEAELADREPHLLVVSTINANRKLAGELACRMKALNGAVRTVTFMTFPHRGDVTPYDYFAARLTGLRVCENLIHIMRDYLDRYKLLDELREQAHTPASGV